jgi:hypothetical protein
MLLLVDQDEGLSGILLTVGSHFSHQLFQNS